MTQTTHDWHARARALEINGNAFVDGRYVAAASGATFDCVSPIDGRVLGGVASTDAADVDLAVTAARRAFESGTWSRQPPRERKRVLLRFAQLIEQHADELALLETLDMGKPIADSLAVDIPATVRCITWYAEAIDKLYDEVAPTGHDALALITREPIGVVGVIVPWNFPLIMATWKIGPALIEALAVRDALREVKEDPLLQQVRLERGDEEARGGAERGPAERGRGGASRSCLGPLHASAPGAAAGDSMAGAAAIPAPAPTNG